MSTVREEVEDIAAKAANGLGRTLKRVGWLSRGSMGPIPERNTVVHLAAALDGLGYAVFAEAQLKRKPRQAGKTGFPKVDLVAHKKAVTFVIEVKAFGKPDVNSILLDARRLLRFGRSGPRATPFSKRHRWAAGWQQSAKEFWDTSEHWGVVVIQSSRGADFTRLWMSMGDPERFIDRVVQERAARHGSKALADYLALLRLIGKRDLIVSSASVLGGETGEHWVNTNPIDIIALAFRIDR